MRLLPVAQPGADPRELRGDRGLHADRLGSPHRAVDAIEALQERGVPFCISRAALETMRRNDWPRPLPYVEMYCNGTIHTCCRDVGNPDVCAHCGYGINMEITQILRLRPGALW